MRSKGNLQDVEINNQRTGLDHEELFGSLYAMESDGTFVAVAYARISIVVG